MKKIILIIATIVLWTVPAAAATKIWVGTDPNYEGDWSDPNNWSPAGVPVDDDNVYIENSSQDVNAGLDQSDVNLAGLNIGQDYLGKIGTTTAYLQIGAAKVDIGYTYGPGTVLTGSGRIKLNLGTAGAAITIHNSAAIGTELTMPPVRILCNNASNTLNIKKGKAGIAYETGETATLGTVISSWTSSQMTDVDLYISSGVTMTTLNQTGGDVLMGCGGTAANISGGTLITYGTGAITTVNASGGMITSNSTGTITTLNITGGTTDFTKSAAARTVTTIKLDSAGVLKFDPGVVTLTNKIISNNPVAYTASAP